jgi:hypothetical protein
MIKGKVRFSQTSYEQNNSWGIQKAKEVLQKGGYEVAAGVGTERYVLDIEAKKDGQTFWFEAEVKTGYKFTSAADFTFPTLSFLERKRKWSGGVGFWYFIICKDTEAFVLCHSSDIYRDEYRECMEISTTEYKGHDCFYRVPLEKCLWNQLPK